MNKILIITLMLTFSAYAGTDGEDNLSKNNPGQIKDCFEKLNRGTFALNQGLDKAILKPVAKAYRGTAITTSTRLMKKQFFTMIFL